MEPCTRCGTTDRHRMIALMSHWFASHAELQLEGGYFYLCPACYDAWIEPHYEAIITAIQEHQRPDRVAREAAAPEGTPTGDAAPAGSASRAGTGAAATVTPAPPSAKPANGPPSAPGGAAPAPAPAAGTGATGAPPPAGSLAPKAKPARRRKPPSAPPPG